jgi:hypothetical protein
MKTVLPLAFALALAPVQLVRAQAPAARAVPASAAAPLSSARDGQRSARWSASRRQPWGVARQIRT